MSKTFLVFIAAITSCYFVACTCKNTVTVTKGELNITTIGFQVADVDSAMLIYYQADNNFDIVTDTIKNVGVNWKVGDTIQLPESIKEGQDCRLIFPTLGLTYTFTQMHDVGATSNKVNCRDADITYKTDVSCNISGQLYTGPGYGYYIRR